MSEPVRMVKGTWLDAEIAATRMNERLYEREPARWTSSWKDVELEFVSAADYDRLEEQLRRLSEAAKDYERQATQEFHRADAAGREVERLREALREIVERGPQAPGRSDLTEIARAALEGEKDA